MWSEGGEAVKMNKAMWLYPKVSGFSPSERWGHSACFSNGNLYVFGGCCGGLHFSDVLVLNIDTMVWRSLVTTGQGPGPRDSHSSVLVGHRMVLFGGTNGSKKVNDLHILDLRTMEWTQPEVRGRPPSARESHTATLIGTDKIVIFGGSGEGDGNYLNDLHILELKTMRWTSPEPKGQIPVPRDSHSAVSIDNKLVVYGGDCGDRYHGDVDVIDMDTITWSKCWFWQINVQGFSPGVRAGHGAVSIGTKVYVIGGVGDKNYYSDVWVLDVKTSSWSRLDIRGHQPQGRFSHTAAVMGTGIAIYGGCGEDERPLNELVILQLREENHPIRELGSHKFSDALQRKRRREVSSSAWEVESEQEEHSLSLSQNSSPSQSDHEQTPVVTVKTAGPPKSPSGGFHFFKQSSQQQEFRKCVRRPPPEAKQQMVPPEILPVQNLIGADVCGKVDGAFDSGYLVTATVNGKVFRGVLFPPGPVSISREAVLAHQHPPPQHRHFSRQIPAMLLPSQNNSVPDRSPAKPFMEPNQRTDLQGVVLTLGGPGTGLDP
ncbi:hypothetical protein SAY87_015376 [Trapa incisa]|uniref:Uncharacterized protein n=1 Tax=Trapa incisa TaxID=236973 RepID=A0AAN7GLK6_9MYRT|nr:hypothetical protein SAY87_015376 [Trapa incisa]